MTSKIRSVIILSGGFLFCLDRWLKLFSLNRWAKEKLINDWLGWLPSNNGGIAFGLPLPNGAAVALSLVLLAILFFILLKQKNSGLGVGLWLITAGGISNLIDRIFFSHVLDYFLVWISMFNLADVMIVGGALMALITQISKLKSQNHNLKP